MAVYIYVIYFVVMLNAQRLLSSTMMKSVINQNQLALSIEGFTQSTKVQSTRTPLRLLNISYNSQKFKCVDLVFLKFRYDATVCCLCTTTLVSTRCGISAAIHGASPKHNACAIPNLGAFFAHRGLKWIVRHILPPRYILDVLLRIYCHIKMHFMKSSNNFQMCLS